ncbi:cyclic nucleotide-gated ion channel 1 [Citrus sinensis]|uniref:Cyclic nucleotide-gated ion channel 1 n=2 Tax=Citrus sinensis TaxID=2711 RepID=A0ACB8LBP3_CITSI|nr:cyclic nucleotide-gated ion channel 1 [Citrus sinensis]
MPLYYWGEALASTTYLINRTPLSSLGFQTPFQVLNKAIISPNVLNLPPHVFGCGAFVHLPQQDKLSPRALHCVFVGSDHTLFIKKRQGKITALIVYVDDMVVTGNDGEEIEALQKKYALDLLYETRMSACQPIDTPIEEGLKFCITPDQVPVDKGRYQRLIGRLMYLSHTRPDLAYALSVVNWAESASDRRSTLGYFTFVGGNLVTWRSKKQHVVARSSAEAEYRGIALGGLQLEEGRTGPPSGERRDGTCLFWENVRNSCSRAKNCIAPIATFLIFILSLPAVSYLTAGLISVALFLVAMLSLVMFLQILVPIYWRFAVGEKTFISLRMIAITLDPFFFYIPVLNNQNKCFQLDRNLGITATVLRSFIDLHKLPRIIHLIYVELCGNKEEVKKSAYATARLWIFFLIDILAVLPIPQVFGALWYFLAIEKVTACWKKTCINHHIRCSSRSFYCDDSLRDYKFLDEFCPITTGNKTNYDFGLFEDALQSGIVGVTDFPQKFLHCLRWGLQNLSAFGQNLEASTDILDNIFAICMTNFGVVLFVFLIGKMQSDTERSRSREQKLKEIKQGPSFGRLSSRLQQKIKNYKQQNWIDDKHADVVNLVNNLPQGLRSQVKGELGTELLRNVKEFERWGEKELVDLSDCLNPVFFTDRTRIFREGDPIDEMVFVLEGKLWSHSARNVTIATSSDGHNGKKDYLRYGDFCGEELIAWAQQKVDNPSSSNLPISTTTIQALTEVEGFYLLASDLKNAFIEHRRYQIVRAVRLIQTFWRFRRILRFKMNQRRSINLENSGDVAFTTNQTS